MTNMPYKSLYPFLYVHYRSIYPNPSDTSFHPAMYVQICASLAHIPQFLPSLPHSSECPNIWIIAPPPPPFLLVLRCPQPPWGISQLCVWGSLTGQWAGIRPRPMPWGCEVLSTWLSVGKLTWSNRPLGYRFPIPHLHKHITWGNHATAGHASPVSFSTHQTSFKDGN